LIANPRASSTHERLRDQITSLFARHHEVRLALTTGRGHAAELGHQAATDGTDLVVVIGGDGTVNETVNGMLADGPAADGPSLAVIPGGHANVLAYALGLPREPMRAARTILQILQDDTPMLVGLGRADERWFTINAGLGMDAAVVATVEDLRDRGVPSSTAAYTAGLVKAWVSSDRGDGPIRISAYGQEGGHVDERALMSTIIQNARPWTLIGDIAVEASPGADLRRGIDVVGLRSLSTPMAVRTATSMLTGKGMTDGPDALVLSDQSVIEVSSERSLPLQVDGDLVGEVTHVVFRAVPNALRIVAASAQAR
jgi:diacylglycerol kinase family enzyme